MNTKTEIVETTSTALTPASQSGDVMTVLQSAIDKGHSVEVVERLLDMQERILRTQARQAYAQALHAVQSAVQPVRMSGYNEHTKKRYGRLEEMWAELRPLLQKNGFALSFGEDDGSQGKIRITCSVMHVGGHAERYHLDLPSDSSGSKNAIQGIGSTVSYGRRYLVGMIFGVVFSSDDDDGEGGEVELITQDQELNIRALLDQLPTQKETGLLNWLKVKKIADIPATKYTVVVRNLEKMIKDQPA